MRPGFVSDEVWGGVLKVLVARGVNRQGGRPDLFISSVDLLVATTVIHFRRLTSCHEAGLSTVSVVRPDLLPRCGH